MINAKEFSYERGVHRILRRLLPNGEVLSVDPAGRFQFGTKPIKDCPGSDGHLHEISGSYLEARRRFSPTELDYLIFVPTLRCNLSCSYCQVSRASELAKGYDWDEHTLNGVLDLVSGLTAEAIKIEFQGGEPTLRPDLIQRVIYAVPDQIDATFVICTNLQDLNDEVVHLFDRNDVYISTSLDGPIDLHHRQRASSDGFADNLKFVLARYGPHKVSALPTIDPSDPPEPSAMVKAFEAFGFNSIYLRPINYQGFARKRHAQSRLIGNAWWDYQRRFIGHLIEHNWINRTGIEETYFSVLLRRIFRPGSDRHVDLRNPNPVGRDCIVIDYDGTAYPTDEARMLTRAGVIDLSIGDVHSGWDSDTRAALDAASTLDGDPECGNCVYRSYCGRDAIDDISRYGTVDLPRHETEFCKRHMALFDLAFELISSDDEKVRYSLGRWLDLPGSMPLMENSA